MESEILSLLLSIPPGKGNKQASRKQAKCFTTELDTQHFKFFLETGSLCFPGWTVIWDSPALATQVVEIIGMDDHVLL